MADADTRVKCKQCSKAILQRTAHKTGGLCRICERRGKQPAPMPINLVGPLEHYDAYTANLIEQDKRDLVMAAAVEQSGLKDLKFGKLNRSCLDALANQLSGGRAILELQDFVKDVIREQEIRFVKNGESSSDDQAQKDIVFRLAGHGFQWKYRGLARRIRFNDPRELAFNIFLNARFAWLDVCEQHPDFVLIWKIFQPFATGDAFLRSQFAQNFELQESSNAEDLFFNSLLAINQSEFQYLRDNEDHIRDSKDTKWKKGVLNCLYGIAIQDSKCVANGISEVLKNHRKLNLYNPLESLISIEAHGLYQLAKSIDASLISDFKTELKLPWDIDFHNWLNDNLAFTLAPDLNGFPEFVQSAIKTLKFPQAPDAG